MSRYRTTRHSDMPAPKSYFMRFVIVLLIILVFVVLFPPWKTSDEINESVGQRVMKKVAQVEPKKAGLIKRSATVLDTKLIIKVISDDPAKVQQAVDKIYKETVRVINMLDADKKDSPVAEINAAAGKGGVKVSDELLDLIERCKELSLKTKGKFDITLRPILEMWNFDQLKPVMAEAKEVEKKLPLVGADKIRIDKGRSVVFLPEKGMGLDFRAVVRAYVLERARLVMREMELSNYFIFMGSDAICSGSDMGTGWQIVLQHPRKAWNYYATVTLKGEQSLGNAFDFIHFFQRKGFRYHEILEPETGIPHQHSRVVSALASNPLEAKALAYAGFVLGQKDGLKFADEIKAALVIMNRRNEAKASKAMQPVIEIKEGKNAELNQNTHQD